MLRIGRCRPLRQAVLGALLAALGACSQFGIPDFPPELRAPVQTPGELFVVYDPASVLGFGHTGLIVANPHAPGFDRYDQYASSEIALDLRRQEGRAWFWQAVTSRIPAIIGTTREYVTRRSAKAAGELMLATEFAVPVEADPASRRAIHAAAEARFSSAYVLESPDARRYFLLTNNCQSFLLDLLHSGGLPEDDYFPKHLMQTYLDRYRRRLAEDQSR